MKSGDRVRIVKPYTLRGRPLPEWGEVGKEGVVVGVVVDAQLAEVDGVGRAGERRFWHPFDGLEVIGRIPPGQWVYDETAEAIIDTDGVIGRHQPLTGRLAAAAPTLAGLLVELVAIEGPQPGNVEWARKVLAALVAAGVEVSDLDRFG